MPQNQVASGRFGLDLTPWPVSGARRTRNMGKETISSARSAACCINVPIRDGQNGNPCQNERRPTERYVSGTVSSALILRTRARSGRCMMRPTNAIASAMSDTPAIVSGTNWEIDP